MKSRYLWLPGLILVLVVLTLLLFQRLAFSDLILARGDTFVYFYPYWEARSEAFRAGQLPLWTPDIFMGAPLLANPQIGTFYPPNWILTPFSAPDAIRYSVLLHVVWAGLGAALLLRAVMPAGGWLAALLAGMIYGLGGYLGAHVEQINQLQGAAWLPWLLVLLHLTLSRPRRWRWALLLAAVWAMQIFTGHTQTVFISGVALGIYSLIWALTASDAHLRRVGMGLALIALTAVVAALLAVPQLLPTLELTGLSNRGGGGFNVQQATAFSLPPGALGRALLPSYDGLLFTEYIAYVGLIGLGLAIYGGIASRERTRWPWIVLTLLGVLLALGRFNPVYLLLAELPGFNLFRVPARWLMLFALSAALLSGYGLAALRNQPVRWRLLNLIGVLLTLFAALTRFVLPVDPADVNGPAIPTDTTLALWLAAIFALVLIAVVPGRWRGPLAVGIVGVELLAASAVLPYNDLAPRDVYEGQRFTISQMRALAADDAAPGRILAISGLNFDPGDLADLERRYRSLGMDDNAIHTALVAVKKGEMAFPNLPLTWGLPSVDGFGGGVLPTTHYTQFTSLLLPDDALRTVDGRLGEILARPDCRGACLPDSHLLAMIDARYLIADKVFDVVHEGLFYDTTFDYVVTPATAQQLHPVNGVPFTATEIRILRPQDSPPPQVIINCETTCETLALDDDIVLENGFVVSVHRLEAPAEIAGFLLTTAESRAGGAVYSGAALVDTRMGAFIPALHVPRILSSDIKLYDLGDETMRRANVVHRAVPFADTWQGSEDAIAAFAAREMLPTSTTAIHGDVPLRDSDTSALASSAIVSRYEATRVEVHVSAAEPGYLVLADAYYPGWRATVNGDDAPLYRANVMFRAVPVSEGESTVVFTFAPQLWRVALIAGGVFWGIWVLMWLSFLLHNYHHS